LPSAIAGRVVAFMAMSGSQWCSVSLEIRPSVGHIGPSAAFRRLPDTPHRPARRALHM